jgi:hypothetical protein
MESQSSNKLLKFLGNDEDRHAFVAQRDRRLRMADAAPISTPQVGCATNSSFGAA